MWRSRSVSDVRCFSSSKGKDSNHSRWLNSRFATSHTPMFSTSAKAVALMSVYPRTQKYAAKAAAVWADTLKYSTATLEDHLTSEKTGGRLAGLGPLGTVRAASFNSKRRRLKSSNTT